MDVMKRKRERIDSDKWIRERVECKEGSVSGKEREGVRRRREREKERKGEREGEDDVKMTQV